MFAAATAATAFAAPAEASELFGGLYVHDVKTPLSLSGIEGGMDVMLGWRGNRIGRTRIQPYVFGALNSSGETSYAAAGISARFGDKVFVRPGLGIAVHNGSSAEFNRIDEIAFGSRVLFAPEIAVGTRIGRRAAIEASLVHMSHGGLLSAQNPGIDNLGVRLTLGL